MEDLHRGLVRMRRECMWGEEIDLKIHDSSTASIQFVSRVGCVCVVSLCFCQGSISDGEGALA